MSFNKRMIINIIMQLILLPPISLFIFHGSGVPTSKIIFAAIVSIAIVNGIDFYSFKKKGNANDK